MAVASRPSEVPADPVVVLLNPDDDFSPEATRAFRDELLAGPEPDLESIGAAEAVRELRGDRRRHRRLGRSRDRR